MKAAIEEVTGPCFDPENAFGTPPKAFTLKGSFFEKASRGFLFSLLALKCFENFKVSRFMSRTKGFAQRATAESRPERCCSARTRRLPPLKFRRLGIARCVHCRKHCRELNCKGPWCKRLKGYCIRPCNMYLCHMRVWRREHFDLTQSIHVSSSPEVLPSWAWGKVGEMFLGFLPAN